MSGTIRAYCSLILRLLHYSQPLLISIFVNDSMTICCDLEYAFAYSLNVPIFIHGRHWELVYCLLLGQVFSM